MATRLLWIEWLRGIAAAMVLLSHHLDPIWPAFHDFQRTVLDFGRVGVVAFFLVSGFVVPLSYRRQSTRVFLVRRVSRLYPVYLTVLVVAALLSPHAEWSSLAWWGEVALNATMLQELILPSIIPVAWTLTIELIYYFQQIGFKQIKRLDNAWLFGYVWAAGFVLAVIAERVLDRELPITFPMLLAVACVGHALSLSHTGALKRQSAVRFSTIIVAVLVLASLLRVPVDPTWPPHVYASSLFAGIALFALLFLLRRLVLPWAVWLGGISYALYLTHSLTITLVDVAPIDLKPMAAALSVVLAFASAWALHRFIEKPFIRLGRLYSPVHDKSASSVETDVVPKQ